jgi:hypothetical protein
MALVVIVLWCSGAYASPSLTLNPVNGIVFGEPGQTVGWGFSFTNDTAFFLLVDGSNFCGPGGDPHFTDCSTPYNGVTQFGPAFGTYTDFIATNVTLVAPNSTFSQTFDSTVPTGVGSYTINPGAPIGGTDPANPAVQVSKLFIDFAEFSGNPFLPGAVEVTCDPTFGTCELAAAAELMVVPEPATFGLVGVMLLLVGSLALRRKRKSVLNAAKN